MTVSKVGTNDTKTSVQTMMNRSYDREFDVNTVELLGHEPVGNTLNRIKVNTDGELVANIETSDIEIGAVEIKNGADDTRAVVGTKGLEVFDQVANSLVPAVYDYISLSYTGDNLTGVVFKTGGSGGTTISTLTLAYTGAQLDTVTKS